MILFSIVWFCSCLGIHRQTLDAPDISDIWMVKVDQSRYSSTASVEHQGHDLGVVWCSSTKHGHPIDQICWKLWHRLFFNTAPTGSPATNPRHLREVSIAPTHFKKRTWDLWKQPTTSVSNKCGWEIRKLLVTGELQSVACKWMFISLGFDQLTSRIKSTYVP